MSLFPAYALEDAESCTDVQGMQEMSPACEASLLASDDEAPPPRSPPPPPPPPPPSFRDTFYLDPKSDYGNLRVSTLYYPGRPQYASRSSAALGAAGGAGGAGGAGARKRRYFEARAPEPGPLADELAPRLAAFRAMLADTPTDVDLWLQFIRFQVSIGTLCYRQHNDTTVVRLKC
ncbi:uncharacterized protein LOC114351644 [Ostrinia furnacalis]|uniref:uncharacterized protein LOC114351644 n=1 Tax=Ostrinia furnacalis TaxID=93504 RepID=UPI00103A92BC|nr:uncharacterized protein LOC114351644 [Ostrinia furnacalis]